MHYRWTRWILVCLALCGTLSAAVVVTAAPYDIIPAGIEGITIDGITASPDTPFTTTDSQPTLTFTLTPGSDYLPEGATDVLVTFLAADGSAQEFTVAVDPTTGDLTFTPPSPLALGASDVYINDVLVLSLIIAPS